MLRAVHNTSLSSCAAHNSMRTADVGSVQHDVVPRASLWALEELRKEVAQVDWEVELKRKASS